ncbi:MAG: hypothetical protein H6709_02030 [Kofleriaceae bacterium]|nr:hypothetical protein [Kofleriaceae bacterium]
MKLQLREHPQPAPSLLEALWSFVSGRMDVEAFEISVYDHLDGLEALLASDTAEQLLALNYATVDADVLRRTIKQAIEGIPTSCECVKIPPAVVLDTGFLARIDGAGELIEYVDGQVLRSFSPVRTDEALSGSWQHRGPLGVGPTVYLHEGRIFRCDRCQTRWLAMFDESTVAYLFLELSAEEADEATTHVLEQRLQAATGYHRCDPQPAAAAHTPRPPRDTARRVTAGVRAQAAPNWYADIRSPANVPL